MLAICKFEEVIKKIMQPRDSAYMFAVNWLRLLWAIIFFSSRLRIAADSQNRSKLWSNFPISPYKLEASTVRPKSIPSRIMKKIYSIRFSFISSIAFGKK